ncbi:MAG: anti-sigma factor family protein [Pirellula sp.]
MMPPDPRKIEEWLSGMLDGVLSEQEQRELELAMQNDPSIAERLEELASMRRSLLGGRPVGRLGADFSKRVVSAARERASAMDGPPAWVLPDAPNAVSPRPQEQPSEPEWREDEEDGLSTARPFPVSVEMAKPMVRGLMGSGQEQRSGSIRERSIRLWLPALAVVAGLCALYLLLPRNAPITNNGTSSVAENRSSEPKNSSEENSSPTAISPSNENVAQGQTTTNQKVAEPEVPEPKPDPSVSKSPDGLLAKDDKSTVPMRVESDKESNPAAANVKATDKFSMVLVADITVDPEATQNGMLDQLLEKYEIISSTDVDLEKTDVEALVRSQILKKPAGDLSEDLDQVTVYIVKSRLTRLDSLIQDIQKQDADFPFVRLDATVDPAVVKLMDHLSAVSDVNELSRRLTFKNVETGESSNSIGQPRISGKANRNPGMPQGVRKGPSSQEQGYLLLLVRYAK